MARTAHQPSSTDQPSNDTDQPAPNGRSPRDQQGPRDEKREHGSRPGPRCQPGGVQRTVVADPAGDQPAQATGRLTPVTSTPLDAHAATLDITKMSTSVAELTSAVVTLQQAFASMIGAADTSARDTNARDTNGDQRRHAHTAVSAAPASSAAPDQIEHHHW